MPFDYIEYEKKCQGLSAEQLQREWENYTRQLAGGATSTATSVLFSPLTAGISLIGLGLSAPRVHNARKKRDIIQTKLEELGTTHNTRKRDVIAPMAVAGTLGGLTLGLAGPGADIIAGEAVGKGAEYAIAHAALDVAGATLEHKHDGHTKNKAEHKLQSQYQNFQVQYQQEQAKLQAQAQIKPAEPLHYTPQPTNGLPWAAPKYISEAVTIQNPQMPRQILSSDQKTMSGPPVYQPGLIQNSQMQSQIPVHDQKSFSGPPLHHPGLPGYQTAQQQQQFSQRPVSMTLSPTNSSPLPVYSELYSRDMRAGPSDQKFERIQVQSETTSPRGSESGGTASNIPLTSLEPVDQLTSPTMQEEIAFLKGRLLEMELEKRGIITANEEQAVQPLPHPELNSSSTPEPQVQSSVSHTTVPATDAPEPKTSHLTVQTCLPSRVATPNLAPTDSKSPVIMVQPHMPSRSTTPNIQSVTSGFQNVNMNFNACPPTSSVQAEGYGFPPPSTPAKFLAPYQPQHYPILPSSAPQQQQYQKAPQQMHQARPQFSSQDSGYHSQSATPGLISSQPASFRTPFPSQNDTLYSQQQCLSPQTTGYSVLTPQSTGGFSALSTQSTGNTSFSSFSMEQHSPMSAQTPIRYFPPPPPPGSQLSGPGQFQYKSPAPSPPQSIQVGLQPLHFSAPYTHQGYGQAQGQNAQPIYFAPPPNSLAPQRRS